MKSISFLCEVVTPMFLAGADVDEPEIRPPSIKGALRWWWRALNGNLSREQLWQKEAELFGVGGDQAKRSKVNILVKNGFVDVSSNNLPEKRYAATRARGQVDIMSYLSYGVKNSRRYIPPRTVFEIELVFSKKLSDNDIEMIIKSFRVLSKYGSIGARSRNGYGCFKIKGVINENQLKGNSEISFIAERTAEFPSFSNGLRLFKTQNYFPKWDEALSVIGILYREKKIALDQTKKYDNRKYIASPIGSINKRFAKSFFLHVGYEKDKGYFGQILFLPSNYAPAPEQKNQFLNTCKKLCDSFAADKKMKEEKVK